MEQPYKQHGICDAVLCKKCKYSMYMSGYAPNIACDYIGATDHMRPCPAGKGCTVFEPKAKQKGTNRKPLQVVEKRMKKCEMCGNESMMNPKQRFCDACAHIRALEWNRLNSRNQREKKRQAKKLEGRAR